MSLNFIRNRHSWFIRGILIVIAVAFIIGIGVNLSDFGAITNVPDRAAAKVNGEDVSLIDFYIMRDSLKKQVAQGGEIPQEYMNQINVIALNQLINLKLMAQKAKNLGFRVTDEELSTAITNDPNFQIDGKFVGGERYQQLIEQALHQEVGDFENSYREKILAGKLARFLDETTIITDENLFDVYNKENEKLSLYYISFPATEYAGSYAPDEKEIKDYYDKHKSELKTAETRQIRYFTLSPETFEKSVVVSEDEINSYYSAYPEEFKSQEGNQIPLSEAKGDIEKKLKAQKADALRQQLTARIENQGGSGLDELAKEFSIETISESKPFAITKFIADVPPMVTRQAFSIDKDAVSLVPVGTSTWVIEVTSITPPGEKTLDEAKGDITAILKREKSLQTARTNAEEALKKLKGVKSDKLPAEAKKLGLELKETGLFSRSERVPQLNSPLIVSQAFELDPQAGVPNRLYDDRNNFLIITVKERQSANTADFDQAKDTLMEQELEKQRSQIIQKMIQDMRRQAEIVPNSKLFPAQG